MTILISIVSKQTIPNILFIKEKQAEVDKFLFVNTEHTLKRKFSERIKTVCGIAERDCVSVKVIEDNVMNVIQQIESAFEENDMFGYTQFLVNVTGGTKPMALGVYIFFEQKINNAEFYYITFPKSNQYQRLYADSPPECHTLNYRISLEDYLLAYGINIKSKQAQLTKDIEYTKKFTLSERSDMYKEKNHQIQLLENQNNVDGSEWNYYKKNGYFEEYIYSVVKTQLNLNDDQIGLSVKTEQPLVNDPEIPDHEIDVMFVYENKLHIIECKTGVKSKDKDIFEESVFRLYAIKQRIGFSNGYIAVLQELRDDNGNLKTKYTKKAKPSGITVLDGIDIKQETGLLNAIQEIKGKPRTS